MPAIYVSRVSQWIEKHFNAKGGSVITDVDQTAVVQLPFLIGVEDRYLQGWNRYTGSTAVVAVAAQFSRTLLRNPSGSNVMVVVESLFVNGGSTSTPVGVDWAITNGQPNLATVQAAGTLLRRLDFRSGFTDSTSVISFDTNATQFPGSAAVIMRRGIPASATQGTGGDEIIRHPDQEITILPSDALWIASDVVNANLQVNLIWRERALEQSELT